MRKNKTFKVALGGICLALTLVFMFLGSVMPGIELTLFALSSVFTAIMIIESGVGGGILMYAAAVLLGIGIIPNKLAIIPYAFFFGCYGILKFYIEKIHSSAAQIAVKAVLFAGLLCIGLLGFKKLLLGSIHLPDYPVYIMIIAGVVMLLLYDFIFTMIINIYIKRVKNRGADNFKLS